MRLDLFLKASRLVKRRAVASALCDAGRVLINDRAARPAKEVKQGDRITLAFGARSIEVEVLVIPATSKKPATEAPYRVIAEKRLSDENTKWENNLS